MASETDTALMSTTAGQLGAWFGGFIIPMTLSYIMLRFAGSPKRAPRVAITLRVVAVLVAVLLAYAAYLGSGGQFNPGGPLAAVVTVIWAAKQQAARKAK